MLEKCPPNKGGVINVMLFFHSIGVATPMLWKNNILKTLHL
jgi:hypothetical protein